ncbi:MAG: hypothetical protein KDA24_24785 [Deltaproteobacteria bacterium]|nr:hypothetical protein [Deltaproteobacteria bacterium]
MTSEVDWIPGIVAVVVGVGLGIVMAIAARKGPQGAADQEHSGRSRAEARRIRIEDLQQRKDQLIQQLRDLEDTDLAGGIEASSEERTSLEAEAARVLRELHHLIEKQQPKAAADGEDAAPAPAAAPPKAAGMSGELKGALTGGAVVGFAALLFFALQDGTSERTGNMPMTGGDVVNEQSADTSRLPPPGAGAPGAPVPGVPPALQPKESPRVDAARAQVAANPQSVEARVDLGWALVDAEGWIDVFNNAEQLLALDPDNANAMTQQAVVRVRMGQRSVAEGLLDKALAKDPALGRALAWKGSLRWQAGDVDAAKAVWSKGLALYPQEGFAELLKMADGEISPTQLGAPAAGSAETSQPSRGETSQPRPAPAGRPAPITGTVTVPQGTDFPATAVIYVFARPAGQAAGPPLAAVKLPASVGTTPFSIGPDNMPPMMGKRPFPASVDLAARLDLDGNAMSKDGPAAALPSPVDAGATGVSITLKP